MRSPAFYKFLSALLALALALGGAYAAKVIHDTRLEVENFRKQKEAAQQQLDDAKGKLDKYAETYQRLLTDPDFLDHIARERLDYARPDELVFRFDVDPGSNAATGNLDSAHGPANNFLLPNSRPTAPANVSSAHH